MTATAIDLADEERILPLEGGFNFRDFGGYRTAAGGLVRRGMLYRSGVMSHLSAADCETLARLDIAAICDLRAPGERSAAPTRWHEELAIDYYAREYRSVSGNIGAMLAGGDGNAAAARAAMIDAYRVIPYEHAESYRALFERMLAGRLPLLVNCSAGKDRTGIAVALVLGVLDVPREAILADYLLTARADLASLTAMVGGKWSTVPAETLKPLLSVEADYLDAAFATIEARHGSMAGYLQEQLGVGAAETARLRTLLIDG